MSAINQVTESSFSEIEEKSPIHILETVPIPIQNSKNASDKSDPLIASSTPKQIYFTLFKKIRRFPAKGQRSGYISSALLILILSLIIFINSISIIFFIINNPSSIEMKQNYSLLLLFSFLIIATLVITEISLLDVTTSIPGYQTTKKISLEEFEKLKPTITVKDKTFNLKYCDTCHIIRDVRTFHCSDCGHCVEKHDHHCGFTSNCIGKYNHKKFYLFLWILFFHCTYVSGIGIDVVVICLEVKDKPGFLMLATFLGMALMVILFFVVFSITLIGSHTCLISSNITTNEDIRNKYDYAVFNNGFAKNWEEVCCINDHININISDIENN